MIKSKLAERCLAVFLACLWANLSVAQEECAAIKNDIARLECFDQLVSDDIQPVGTPIEEFREFYELISSEYVHGDNGISIVGASFLEDTCEVAILNLYYRERIVSPVTEGYEPQPLPRSDDGLPLFSSRPFVEEQVGGQVSIAFFDAADVQDLNLYRSRGVEVSMERGTTIHSYSAFDRTLENREFIRSAFSGIASAFENDSLPSDLLRRFERDFSSELVITTRRSEMDREAIVDALWDLHEACNATG